MHEEVVRTWQKILVDTILAILGIVIIVNETIIKDVPNLYVMGFGAVLLGIPPARRLDLRRSNGD